MLAKARFIAALRLENSWVPALFFDQFEEEGSKVTVFSHGGSETGSNSEHQRAGRGHSLRSQERTRLAPLQVCPSLFFVFLFVGFLSLEACFAVNWVVFGYGEITTPEGRKLGEVETLLTFEFDSSFSFLCSSISLGPRQSESADAVLLENQSFASFLGERLSRLILRTMVESF